MATAGHSLRGFGRQLIVKAVVGAALPACEKHVVRDYRVYVSSERPPGPMLARLEVAMRTVDEVDQASARYLRRFCKRIIVDDGMGFATMEAWWSAILRGLATNPRSRVCL